MPFSRTTKVTSIRKGRVLARMKMSWIGVVWVEDGFDHGRLLLGPAQERHAALIPKYRSVVRPVSPFITDPELPLHGSSGRPLCRSGCCLRGFVRTDGPEWAGWLRLWGCRPLSGPFGAPPAGVCNVVQRGHGAGSGSAAGHRVQLLSVMSSASRIGSAINRSHGIGSSNAPMSIHIFLMKLCNVAAAVLRP